MAPWDPIIDPIRNGFTNWVIAHNLNQTPGSVVLILVVSLLTSGLSIWITRLTVDMEKINKQTERVQRWNRMNKKARATADKKLWLRVQREKDAIQQLQMKMMTSRMKPMFFTTIPFILIFSILRGIFDPSIQGDNGIVAILPFAWDPTRFNLWFIDNIGKYYNEQLSGMTFTAWYFLTSLSFGSLLSKVFGTAPPSTN